MATKVTKSKTKKIAPGSTRQSTNASLEREADREIELEGEQGIMVRPEDIESTKQAVHAALESGEMTPDQLNALITANREQRLRFGKDDAGDVILSHLLF